MGAQISSGVIVEEEKAPNSGEVPNVDGMLDHRFKTTLFNSYEIAKDLKNNRKLLMNNRSKSFSHEESDQKKESMILQPSQRSSINLENSSDIQPSINLNNTKGNRNKKFIESDV